MLSLWFALAFLRGQSIKNNAAFQYDVFALQHDLPQAVLQAGNGLIQPMTAAEPHLGKEIPKPRRAEWTATCDSEKTDNAWGNAVHDSCGTFWQIKNGTTDTQGLGDYD